MTNNGRTSAIMLAARMFGCVLVISVGSSVFWNGISGREMFPIGVSVVVAVVVTAFLLLIGFVVVTLGGNALLGNDPEYQRWRAHGGRPYLDSLPKPINPDASITRETGLAEPEYTDFVPPAGWRFQCPVCGSRVEKKIDVCWRCRYGRDGNSTAYFERFGR